MIYYFFAMQREADMLDVPNKYVIGINATDMPETTDEDIIINIGYCGSNDCRVGTIIEPTMAVDSKTLDAKIINAIFDCNRLSCYTADSFVTEPLTDKHCIYDMELYKIACMPHKRLYSLKIVSDNLCEADCEQYNDKNAWEEVKRILERGKKNIEAL